MLLNPLEALLEPKIEEDETNVNDATKFIYNQSFSAEEDPETTSKQRKLTGPLGLSKKRMNDVMKNLDPTYTFSLREATHPEMNRYLFKFVSFIEKSTRIVHKTEIVACINCLTLYSHRSGGHLRRHHHHCKFGLNESGPITLIRSGKRNKDGHEVSSSSPIKSINPEPTSSFNHQSSPVYQEDTISKLVNNHLVTVFCEYTEDMLVVKLSYLEEVDKTWKLCSLPLAQINTKGMPRNADTTYLHLVRIFEDHGWSKAALEACHLVAPGTSALKMLGIDRMAGYSRKFNRLDITLEPLMVRLDTMEYHKIFDAAGKVLNQSQGLRSLAEAFPTHRDTIDEFKYNPITCETLCDLYGYMRPIVEKYETGEIYLNDILHDLQELKSKICSMKASAEQKRNHVGIVAYQALQQVRDDALTGIHFAAARLDPRTKRLKRLIAAYPDYDVRNMADSELYHIHRIVSGSHHVAPKRPKRAFDDSDDEGEEVDNVLETELVQFLAIKGGDMDPASFWPKNSEKYPKLSLIAQKLYSISTLEAPRSNEDDFILEYLKNEHKTEFPFN